MKTYVDTKLAVGDRVRYSHAFLIQAGVHTGAEAFRSGVIQELPTFGGRAYVRVLWDDEPDEARLVAPAAVWGDDRLHTEPA